MVFKVKTLLKRVRRADRYSTDHLNGLGRPSGVVEKGEKVYRHLESVNFSRG